MQLEDRFMQTDYKRAMKDKLSPPCGKPAGAQIHPQSLEEHDADQRKLVCYHCGVACDMEGMRVERREFLDRLGATRPGDGSHARERRIAKQDRVARGEAPHDLRQGEGVRIRMQIRKTGADAMTGHLDLIRKIPRTFRRAGIRDLLFGGLSPEAGDELHAGAAARRRERRRDRRPQTRRRPRGLRRSSCDRLNEVSAEGLEFVACRLVMAGEPRLSALLDQADYLIKLERHGFDEADVLDRMAAFEEAASLELKIARKKGERTIDLKSVVTHLRIARPEDRDALPAAIADGLPALTLAMGFKLDTGGQVKPVEALRAVLGAPELELSPIDLVRLGFWNHAETGPKSPLEPIVVTADS